MFNPHEAVRIWRFEQPGSVQRYADLIAGYDNEKLIERNAHYFAQDFDEPITVRMLWLLNQELTRRGIAPAWRKGPMTGTLKARARSSSASAEPRRELSVPVKQNLLRRWIDLEWLRAELGPDHPTQFRKWKIVFDPNPELAMRGFAMVNKLVSHGAGSVGPRSPHDVLGSLAIPKLHFVALTGLINRDEGERRRNVLERVETKYRPCLERLQERDRHPLQPDEVAKRLVYCEAIELARGSPTDAATIIRWMTGKTVSRQTVAIMRTRIAEQCDLRTQYWRPQRSARTSVSGDSDTP